MIVLKKLTDNKLVTLLLALVVMALWGSLFPMIKVGYRAFGIDTASVADILLFAGFRFVVCGAVLTACSVFSGKQGDRDIKGSIIPIVMTGIFAVILHYAFTYLGLAMSESSKTAILKQLGALFYICFCFVFVKGETFSFAKIAGALLGFGGIIAINAGNDGFGFGLGDVFIILASVCTVVSNIYAKRAMQSNSSVTVTGISQLMGGVVLLAAAFLTGILGKTG
jgi:drug/metabolite transporter (DMT)-like permease